MSSHATDTALLHFIDGELPPRETEGLRHHLAACAECRSRLEDLQCAGELYTEYHQVLKAADPAPPRPWPDLGPTLEAAPARSYGRWLAIAAALLIAVFVWQRVERPPQVSAAELLRKAEAAAPPRESAPPIRIHARGRSLLRSAVLHGSPAKDEREMAALFAAAHYDWEDPLSARAFSSWRDQLPDHGDHVRLLETLYEIRTTTHSNILSEAVLQLSARDLHPVRETMRFQDEVIEIIEAEPGAVPPPRVSPPETPALPNFTAARPAPPAGPAEELRVLMALHRIGADLGEPVDVSREGSAVVVHATGLTAVRKEQVRQAVAALPGVTVRFDEAAVEHLGPAESRRVASPPAVQSELRTQLGDDAVNRILDASEAVMARAYAIRALSRRFPAVVEAQLADAERGVLTTLRSEHSLELAVHLRELEAALAPVVPGRPPVNASAPADWQTGAAHLFTAARQVDQLVNRILAGGDDASSRLPELADALRELDAQVRASGVRP